MPKPTPKSVHQMSIFIWKQLFRNCSHRDFGKLPGREAHFVTEGGYRNIHQVKTPNSRVFTCLQLLCTCLQQSVAGLHLRHCDVNHGSETLMFSDDMLLHQILMPPAHLGSVPLQEQKNCHSVKRVSPLNPIDNLLIFQCLNILTLFLRLLSPL